MKGQKPAAPPNVVDAQTFPDSGSAAGSSKSAAQKNESSWSKDGWAPLAKKQQSSLVKADQDSTATHKRLLAATHHSSTMRRCLRILLARCSRKQLAKLQSSWENEGGGQGGNSVGRIDIFQIYAASLCVKGGYGGELGRYI